MLSEQIRSTMSQIFNGLFQLEENNEGDITVKFGAYVDFLISFDTDTWTVEDRFYNIVDTYKSTEDLIFELMANIAENRTREIFNNASR